MSLLQPVHVAAPFVTRCSKLHLVPHSITFRRPHASVLVPSVPSVRPVRPIRPVRPNPGVAHPNDNPTKSCTLQAARGRLDLVPIQSFQNPPSGGFWLPGENGRRYGNPGPARSLGALATRTLRAPLSPEARSGDPGVRVSVYPGVGWGGVVGGVPPGHAPWACPGGTPPPTPPHHTPGYPDPRTPVSPERASGLRVARRAQGRGSRGKQGSRGSRVSREAG